MIRYAYYDFPFGILKIRYTDAAVVSINVAKKAEEDCERSKLSDLAHGQICAYLAGRLRDFDFPFELRGTGFQKRAWEALCRIPYGETRTYKQVAAELGNPKACRAVGLANNRNPLMIVVPCHRVIGTNGALTGYAGGLEMKKALLELEANMAAAGIPHT